METKHTPGPWVLDNAEEGDWFRYVMAADSQIGRVDLGNRGFISQHGEANARLIAAAPQMLQALGEADHILSVIEDTPFCTDEVTDLIFKIRAAIAKAEGK